MEMHNFAVVGYVGLQGIYRYCRLWLKRDTSCVFRHCRFAINDGYVHIFQHA